MKNSLGLLCLVLVLGVGGCVVEQDNPPSDLNENDTIPVAPIILQPTLYANDVLTIRWRDGNNHVFGPTGGLLKAVDYRAKILATGDTCTGEHSCDIPLPSPSQKTQYVYEVIGRYDGNRYGRPKRDSITVYPQPKWTASASGTSRTLHSVVWNGSLLVAVGDSGIVLTSSDGINWTQQATGTGLNLRAIAWYADRFVAVGDSGKILSSQDALVWTAEYSGTTRSLRAVAGGAGNYVVVGDWGTVLVSSDDTSWIVDKISDENLNIVVWAGQNFVAGGRNAFLTSTDGTAWVTFPEVRYWAPAITFFDFTWGGEKLVGVGSMARCTIANSCGGMPYYPYGFTTISSHSDSLPYWNEILTEVKADLRSIAWNGSLYFAVGGTFQAVSPDGVRWSSKSGVPNLNALAWTGTQWVGVGSGGGIFTSP
jgi:hypothetical protein